ncbi:MAG: response regulator [Candidatus Zixiibacteriota bacterium]
MKGRERILIVEDDELVLSSIEGVLTKEGYQVTTARNGREALELFSGGSYDLVLTDLMMAGVDGLEVLRKVKEVSPETVVIMITGYESLGSATESMRCGAYDYLIKPCKRMDLLAAVRRGLEKRQLEKELMKKERLEAILQITATANHEMNTPLATALMKMESLMKKKASMDEETVRGLETIQGELTKIQTMLSKMTLITDPIETEYWGEVKMIDLERSGASGPSR